MNPVFSSSDIELRVIGEQLKEICRQAALNDKSIAYRSAWCSGHTTIRFRTKELDEVFPDSANGCFFEIENAPETFTVCVAAGLQQADVTEKLLQEYFGKTERSEKSSGYCILRQNLYRAGNQAENRPQALSEWLNTDFVWLRKELRKLAADPSYHPQPFPIPAAETYTEGRPLTKESLAWERDPRARRKCIAIHGTACAVCGFDFGKTYGPEYAGKIEVHHLHPLSEIREEHETDPVRDLVPVCPNCHRMLHSNPDGGVFSVEELKELMKK